MALNLNFAPFSGVGIVSLFARNVDGSPGAGFDLGEAPSFKTTQQSPVSEMNTSRDSSRGVAYRMAQSKGAGVEIQLRTLDDFTLSLLTSGVWADVAAGSALVDWVAPTGLVAGQMIKLPAENVTAVSVKDSSGSPKTLPAGQYELDPMGATIKLLDITTGGAYVQPFKVSATPGAVKVLGGLKAAETDYIVQLNGTNAYNGERGIFKGYKFRLAAEGDADWISDDYGTYTIRGSLLLDSTRLASSAGGQYYSWTKAP
jgi:hypothetical protein